LRIIEAKLPVGVYWVYNGCIEKYKPICRRHIVAEARLSVRVDRDIKQEAEEVFRQLGLTMSAGVNAFLVKVVRQQGIPFDFYLDDEKQRRLRAEMPEHSAQRAVIQGITDLENKTIPVARFDSESGLPFFQLADGTRDYSLLKSAF